jgi:hypothetical protein
MLRREILWLYTNVSEVFISSIFRATSPDDDLSDYTAQHSVRQASSHSSAWIPETSYSIKKGKAVLLHAMEALEGEEV